MRANYPRPPTPPTSNGPPSVHKPLDRTARPQARPAGDRTVGSPGQRVAMTTTLTARSPEDLLAVVPVVLGFVPEDSVVMLTFGAARTFHARVDLPPPDEPPGEVVACLRGPAMHHGVRRVVFVLYTDDAELAGRVHRELLRGFGRVGIEVVDAIRADGERWFPLLRSRAGQSLDGTPYDVTAHPFAAQAVLDGKVMLASRGELAAQLDRDPERVARVAACLARIPPGAVGTPAWVRRRTRRWAGQRAVPGDEEAARLLAAVGRDPSAENAAWWGVSRREAPGHVALWTDLVRRAPDQVAASAAAVLGLVAWVAGHGALAWCAVDHATSLDPGHGLARLVADLLAGAVSPEDWDEVMSAERAG